MYYKDATSLIYIDEDGDTVGVQSIDANYILVPGINIYDVYVPKSNRKYVVFFCVTCEC